MYESEVINLVKSKTAFMGTVDENRPRVRPMRPYIDADGQIWLFSRFDTKKVSELQQNPRVELCFVGDNQEVLTIYGRVKDSTKPGDPEFRVRRDLMAADVPDMKQYFAAGDIDSMVIYRLRVHEIRYMRENCELTTQVNLPMEHDPEVELAMCQGGFCLIE
ncbi:MAG: pyridoxamine 5'-phosphate oxidase family protein [Sporomusaceae bacterium]|nr:pyridoxamine 5'-phosphate oxidase family protein [Sporomusaceae bacterium]